MHLATWRRLSIGLLVLGATVAAAWPALSNAQETETELGNNLSVPTIFVPSVGVGSQACTDADDTILPDPGQTSSEFPGYWVQGEAVWQADCAIAADNTVDVTAAWGDNLAGQASIVVGRPVRVEIGLLADAAAYTMTGFDVEKLEPELLDRESAYGTNDGSGITPYTEVRVWNAGVTLSITGPSTVSVPFSAELNSTGRVVYGYNWRPELAGTYTITANVPTVRLVGTDLGTFNAHTATITVEVGAATGGGGGGGGGTGGGGGQGSAGNGRFATDPVFDTTSGTGVAVFNGGSTNDLVDAVESVGGSGVWVRGGDGGYVRLNVDGPDFTNQSFNETFPDGLSEPTEVVVAKKGG